MNMVSPHGQKLFGTSCLDTLGLFLGGGLCLEMFVINSRGVFLEDRSCQ